LNLRHLTSSRCTAARGAQPAATGAQAQENDQQVSAAKERQADALEKRKAALKSRLASAKQPQGGANSSASSDGKKPASAKKPFPAKPRPPGVQKVTSLARDWIVGSVAGQLSHECLVNAIDFRCLCRGLRVALSVAKIAVPLLRRVATALEFVWSRLELLVHRLSVDVVRRADDLRVSPEGHPALGGGGDGGGGWRSDAAHCAIGEAGREQPIEACGARLAAPWRARSSVVEAPDGSSRRLLVRLVHPRRLSEDSSEAGSLSSAAIAGGLLKSAGRQSRCSPGTVCRGRLLRRLRRRIRGSSARCLAPAGTAPRPPWRRTGRGCRPTWPAPVSTNSQRFPTWW
uniref:4F5 domain-containing protein n=1 Tax=Macrostomum lignano TaxID=282301 RepID=A0A1I8F4P6_9PLAT